MTKIEQRFIINSKLKIQEGNTLIYRTLRHPFEKEIRWEKSSLKVFNLGAKLVMFSTFEQGMESMHPLP